MQVTQKTTLAKPSTTEQKWWRLDAEGKILGRIATRVATILMGKHKPIYTPHIDTGDYVMVYNVEKLRVTGKKLQEKMYKRYSGYPGGQKEEPLAHLLARKPEEVLRLAVRRMLPKSKMGRKMLKKLKIYTGAGARDQHVAQQPADLEI